MVLAGGIAYRVFFWLLALVLVFGGVLGFVDPSHLEAELTDHRFGAWLAAAVANFARSADGREWWLLLVGVCSWTGYTCAKALVLAHATVWHVEPPRISKPRRRDLLIARGAPAEITGVNRSLADAASARMDETDLDHVADPR